MQRRGNWGRNQSQSRRDREPRMAAWSKRAHGSGQSSREAALLKLKIQRARSMRSRTVMSNFAKIRPGPRPRRPKSRSTHSDIGALQTVFSIGIGVAIRCWYRYRGGPVELVSVMGNRPTGNPGPGCKSRLIPLNAKDAAARREHNFRKAPLRGAAMRGAPLHVPTFPLRHRTQGIE